MTQRVLVIGASGGIGSALKQCLIQSQKYDVVGWSSKDLDLNYPEKIFTKDFSNFDIIINCAGHNQGNYQGFLKNSWQNQLSQILVNYASNLFLLKHYANSNAAGKFVWLTSTSVDYPRVFHSVYAGTKVASKFSIDLIKQEAPHIAILEVKVGLTKTNMRYRNFEGTKTLKEVEETYAGESFITAQTVGEQIFDAIENNNKEIVIL